MKLLLTSGGLMNTSMINSLQKLVDKPFEELRLGFIPTAANIEEGDKWWMLDDLETCKKLKFKSIDVIDISAIPAKMCKERLENTDVILVEGGNTYHLRYWFRKSGLDELLPELLKNRVYIGISAGSMVVTPSMILNISEKDAALEVGDEIIDKGLGLVDFLVEPHINSQYFPELTFEYVKKESEKTTYQIYAIDDNSAIEVVNKNITIISEGKWKKFN